MDIAHFAAFSDGQILETDICIVGTGPAGLTLARELSGSRLRVLLLESGGIISDASTDCLNETESIGAPRETDQALLRNRALGGTSAIWAGRTAFFDDIDFEKRDWVPYSGWPLSPDDLRSYLPRTRAHLGVGMADNTDVDTVRRLIGGKYLGNGFNPKLLLEYFWQYSRDEANALEPMRFGRRALAEKSTSIRCIVDATLTHLNTDADGRRLESIEIRGRDGKCCLVKAAATVLCAGGIENARLLLASNRIVRSGVGNAHGLVGRFLMDHRRGAIAEFENKADKLLQTRFALYHAMLDRGTCPLTCGVALAPEIQRAEGLLQGALWLDEVRASDDPWLSVAAIIKREGDMLRHLRNAASNIDAVIAGLAQRYIHRRGVPHKVASLNLQCIVEQRPDPDSRITLADRVDALGMPLARIDWRVSEEEDRTVKRLAQLFSQEMARLGFAGPKLYDMARHDSPARLSLPDVAHPMGTTRMSLDPKSGVVDVNCALHGVAGLYIAGSSVFPTAGHANPTQMIVALCVRLADHLKSTLRVDAAIGSAGQLVVS